MRCQIVALNSGLADTSAASDGVAALGLTVSNRPTQAERQTIANKFDRMITALQGG
jgi:hypothetical protein